MVWLQLDFFLKANWLSLEMKKFLYIAITYIINWLLRRKAFDSSNCLYISGSASGPHCGTSVRRPSVPTLTSVPGYTGAAGAARLDQVVANDTPSGEGHPKQRSRLVLCPDCSGFDVRYVLTVSPRRCGRVFLADAPSLPLEGQRLALVSSMNVGSQSVTEHVLTVIGLFTVHPS